MPNIIDNTFKSSDGIHDIFFRVYEPDTQPKAILQIAHGMCEYFERYDSFARFMADQGYIVCGNDHLGHGHSVNSDDELGWFAKSKGWEKVVSDMHRLTKLMKTNYPDLPYFIFGHSMGSFMTRAYLTRWGKHLDGAVICGTGTAVPGIPALLTLVDVLKAAHGDKYRSSTVSNMAFGSYCSRITDPRTPYDWTSRDNAMVDKYAADPLCTYMFTLNGFENLTKVLWYISQDKWFETYPKSLPTYIISGSADPVGDYGKGVLEVYNKLRLNNCDVEMKIYSDARHELLNEINRDEVYSDVLNFLDFILDPKSATPDIPAETPDRQDQ